MATPTAPGPRVDLQPGWSFDRTNTAGPCYCRHVPGKGMLKVVALGQPGGYAWCLSTSPAGSPLRAWESLTRPKEGFTGPVDAMLDADRAVSRMPPRMFEPLTPGEARELYRKLITAHNWPGTGHKDLDDARNELSIQIRIHATDPAYHGPDPHEFTQAVHQASYGAAEQAMAVSRSAVPRLAGGPDFPGAAAVQQGASPGRRAAGSSVGPAARQARPVRAR